MLTWTQRRILRIRRKKHYLELYTKREYLAMIDLMEKGLVDSGPHEIEDLKKLAEAPEDYGIRDYILRKIYLLRRELVRKLLPKNMAVCCFEGMENAPGTNVFDLDTRDGWIAVNIEFIRISEDFAVCEAQAAPVVDDGKAQML